MKVKCVICNTEFEAIRSTKKYCSDECNYKARRIRENKKVNSLEKVCLLCEQTFILNTAAANHRQCCYDCMPEGTQLSRGQFISKLKEKYGGKCLRCGYDKSLVALDFHHIDPEKKDFTISNDRFKLIEAIEEIKKCILICSNCHREFHAGLWKIEEVVENGIN